MNTLTLAQADAIVAAALAEARKRKLAPLAFVVLDAGGHMVAAKREDNAPFLRFDIACGKAWGCVGLGNSSRELTDRTAKQPAFFGALASMTGQGILPSPGGVLVLGTDGSVLGAVGVSGDTGDNDEACALAGIAAAGLKAKV